MPKVVPSQVIEAIDQVFPNAKDQMDSQQGRFSVDRTYQNEVAAIVELVDQIPAELIKLGPKEHTPFQMAVTAANYHIICPYNLSLFNDVTKSTYFP